jgi:hypothetical protein
MNMFGIDVSACEVFARLCFVATKVTAREFVQIETTVPVSAGVSGVATALSQILRQLHPELIPKDVHEAERFVRSVADYRPWLRVSRAALRRLLGQLGSPDAYDPATTARIATAREQALFATDVLSVEIQGVRYSAPAEGIWEGQATVSAAGLAALARCRFRGQSVRVGLSDGDGGQWLTVGHTAVRVLGMRAEGRS